jgi:hypothetical protein
MVSEDPDQWTMLKSLQLFDITYKEKIDEIRYGKERGLLRTNVIFLIKKEEIVGTISICNCCGVLGKPDMV